MERHAQPPSPESNSSNDDKKGAVNLFNLAENIIKLSAILGAFGYMSLRAHLNYLGIPSTSSLGVERYLMETYNLVVTTFFPLVSVLLRIGAAVFLLYLIARGLKTFAPRLKQLSILKNRSLLTEDKFSEYAARPIVSGLLLLIVLGVYIWLQHMLESQWQYQSVAVGSLQTAHLEQADDVWFYYLVCLLCIFGLVAYRIVSRVQKSQPQAQGYKLARSLLIMFAIGLIAVALHLPILYGRLVHYTDYTWVSLIDKDPNRSAAICGLLVLESQSSLLLWRAEEGAGKIIEVPRLHIQSIATGPTFNLINLAHDAAVTGKNQPDCGR